MNTETTNDNAVNLSDILSVVIIGKRWFRKSTGNTYSSCYLSVLLKDKQTLTIECGPEGGYGDYYLQMAIPAFNTLTKIDAHGYGYLTTFLRQKDIPYTAQVIDVPRERDL